MGFKMNKFTRLLLYVTGALALAICLVDFFGIPVPHLNKGGAEGLDPPEFNVTSLVLALIAFGLFFHEHLLRWLKNIRVTKIKVSEMEVSLEYWKKELNISDPDNAGGGSDRRFTDIL